LAFSSFSYVEAIKNEITFAKSVKVMEGRVVHVGLKSEKERVREGAIEKERESKREGVKNKKIESGRK